MSPEQHDEEGVLGPLGNKLTTRRLVAIVAAGLVTAVALFGLWRPVYLDEYDTFGFQINCGTGISSNETQMQEDSAKAAAYEDDCFIATQLRRAWAIPLAVGGIAVLVVLVKRGVRIDAPRPVAQT